MTPFMVLNVQSTLSLVGFALIARWHIAPRLAARSREDALVPLLWIHVFRYAPLTLFAPGQVDPRVPADVAAIVGYGDLASGLVALLAVVALRVRARAGIGLAWAFSVVGIADLVFATAKAVGAELYTYYLGWNWYIVAFYVPVLAVSHAMIVYILLDRARSGSR